MTHRVVIALIVPIAACVAAVLLLPLPPFTLEAGFESFAVLEWIDRLAKLTVVIVIVVPVVRRLARRRGNAWLDIVLPIVVLVMTTILFLPFFRIFENSGFEDDDGKLRLAVPRVRMLAGMVVTTLALSALFLAVTRRRHTRTDTRHAALAVPAILCGVLATFYFLLLVLPL